MHGKHRSCVKENRRKVVVAMNKYCNMQQYVRLSQDIFKTQCCVLCSDLGCIYPITMNTYFDG
jgi:hypothetical protein